MPVDWRSPAQRPRITVNAFSLRPSTPATSVKKAPSTPRGMRRLLRRSLRRRPR